MRVLVLGVSGMLGNTVFKVFDQDPMYEAWGTMRNPAALHYFSNNNHLRLLVGIDILDQDVLVRTFELVRPDVVINCVGLIKQLSDAGDPLVVLPINAMLPHRLARLCSLAGSRLIHVSTDCVFSGRRGGYLESDFADAEDLYGKSKFIGEISDLPHVITLRTSIIGHELSTNHALIEWFLAQQDTVKGFSRAIFSGLPTAELSRVIKDFVLSRPELNGLYHVAAEPIAKLDLLRLVALQYQKEIVICPDDSLVIDRSLNGECFQRATGYVAPTWSQLIELMYDNR